MKAEAVARHMAARRILEADIVEALGEQARSRWPPLLNVEECE